MSQNWNYHAFTEMEHRDRINRAKKLLASEGLAGCVCTAPELIYYFTGYDAHTHLAIGTQAIVFATEGGDPTMILRDGDVPQATETLSVGKLKPFRLGSVGLGDLIADTISSLGLQGKPVGLDISSRTTTGTLMLSIKNALGRGDLRDSGPLLEQLRIVLSDQEIAYLKKAAIYANAGIDAFYKSARIGMSEIELAAEIEYAVRSAGSDYPAIPTWMASGERAYCQHAMASPRKLQDGDLVHAEFSGAERRYQCVTMGSLVLGPPNAKMKEMAEGGKEAFEAGLAEAKPGARIGNLEAAYRGSLENRGLGDCCPMRFGVGISAAYPPAWDNLISIQYECDYLLEPGMAFYIHASMQSMDDREGMLLGGSFLMTKDGPERLDKAPIELIVL